MMVCFKLDSQFAARVTGFGSCPVSCPRKELELPPAVARAFHAERDGKRDEIAARQAWLLKQHRKGKLRITDVRSVSGGKPERVYS